MSKNNKNNYYAVWGTNGLGVFNNWAKAQKSMSFLEKTNCKGHKTYSAAVKTALKKFNEVKDEDIEEFKGPFPINVALDEDKIRYISDHFDKDDKITALYENGEWTFSKKE